MLDPNGGISDERIRKAILVASNNGYSDVYPEDLAKELFVSEVYAREILNQMFAYDLVTRWGSRNSRRYLPTQSFLASANPLSDGMQALIGTGIFLGLFAGLLYALKPATQ